jgi:hypothetical protein
MVIKLRQVKHVARPGDKQGVVPEKVVAKGKATVKKSIDPKPLTQKGGQESEEIGSKTGKSTKK